MPVKLVPPKAGRSPHYRARGTHLERTRFSSYVDESLGTGDRKTAERLLKALQENIERRAIAGPEQPVVATFMSAAHDYMNAGGEKKFLGPLIKYFGVKPLAEIDQGAIDRAAVELKPGRSAATRNRHVYTPISAILKHAGIDKALKRPKGWQSKPRLHWLKPEQAFALLAAADNLNSYFGALLTTLLYGGMRLSEALRLEWSDVDLQQGYGYLRRTKNGEPQAVHLPAPAVAALANLGEKRGRRIFKGQAKNQKLYDKLKMAAAAAGVIIPPGIAFHILRHSYGAWARRYAGADTSGLVGTGRWKSRASAEIYEHVDVDEAAKVADLFPTRKTK